VDYYLRELFSFCFEQLTDPLSLPLDPIIEYIVLTFIGILAFKLARMLVGDMYDADIIGGSILGSFFHWLIRIGLFAFVWWITNAAITTCRFIAEHWIILAAALGGVLLLVVAFFLIRHFVMQKRLKPLKNTK